MSFTHLVFRSAVFSLVLGALVGCPSDKSGSSEAPANPVSANGPANGPATKPVEQSAQAPLANANLDEGKKLFGSYCASCHGPDGSGSAMRQMLPKIGDLSSPELHTRLSDEQIGQMIVTGRDKMPPFGTILKTDQISAIVRYVRTLKKG